MQENGERCRRFRTKRYPYPYPLQKTMSYTAFANKIEEGEF